MPEVDLNRSLLTLLAWLRLSGSKGYDPYDALSSHLIAWVDRHWRLGGRLAIQAFKLSPLNIRPWVGIRPVYDAKALGLAARGYFLLWDNNPSAETWERGIECLNVLKQLSISGFSGACWAHNFPYRSSRLYMAAGAPSVVSTVYAVQAFLDAYERQPEARWLDLARSSCEFILNDLERIGTDRKFCFSYVPHARLAIHNASLLAAQLLARVSKLTGDDWLAIIGAVLDYTISDQNADGSWYYDGPDSQVRGATFIDGFHTGFVLESLWEISKDTGLDLSRPLYSGFDYYVKHLFDRDGKPLRKVKQPWPVDLRDCAQALIVFSKFTGSDERATKLLHQVLEWTIQQMQSSKGYFFFIRGERLVSPIPYIRFQTWMLCALATVLHNAEQTPK